MFWMKYVASYLITDKAVDILVAVLEGPLNSIITLKFVLTTGVNVAEHLNSREVPS